jgi:hypothetical protein
MPKISLAARVLLCATLLPATVAVSQKPIPDAPVPTAVRNGTKIFVFNVGADSGLFPSPFSGDTNRAYNQFYAGLMDYYW